MNSRHLVGLVLGFSAAGCASNPASTESSSVDSTSQPVVAAVYADPPVLRMVTLPVGDGLRFIDITANGTGCPPLPDDQSSWQASISPDGQAFTVTFSQYEAAVDSSTPRIIVKDCTLGITVRVPNGFTYAVSSFDYGGYVFLDSANMRATQKAEYDFQGDQVRSARGDTTMWGPQDKDYVLHDEIATASLVWAPCGASRNLNVKTLLTLMNNAAKTGNGYINTSVIDGQVKLTINLSWARC